MKKGYDTDATVHLTVQGMLYLEHTILPEIPAMNCRNLVACFRVVENAPSV